MAERIRESIRSVYEDDAQLPGTPWPAPVIADLDDSGPDEAELHAYRSATPQWRRRFDPPAPRTSESQMPPQPVLLATAPAETLAARLMRWQTALQPYAGLAAAIAMMLSAAMMYWTMAGSKSPTPAHAATDAPSWSIDSPVQEQPTAAQPLASAAPDYSAYSQLSLSASPGAPSAMTVQSAPISSTTDQESAQHATDPVVGALADKSLAVENPDELAAALPKAKAEAQATSANMADAVQAPILPAEPITPTASDSIYPTTPYPALDFASAFKAILSQEPAAPAPAVAEGSAASSPESPTPR